MADLAILKLGSWNDCPKRRRKDVSNPCFIIQNYFDTGNKKNKAVTPFWKWVSEKWVDRARPPSAYIPGFFKGSAKPFLYAGRSGQDRASSHPILRMIR